MITKINYFIVLLVSLLGYLVIALIDTLLNKLDGSGFSKITSFVSFVYGILYGIMFFIAYLVYLLIIFKLHLVKRSSIIYIPIMIIMATYLYFMLNDSSHSNFNKDLILGVSFIVIHYLIFSITYKYMTRDII